MKERQRIQRKKASTSEGPAHLEKFAEELDSHGGGNPLKPAEQNFLSAGLAHDFSHVRIHADSEADHLARDVHAKAFTVGSEIFFRAGAYDSSTPEGTQLLAHEAAHTIQSAGAEPGDRAARVVISESHDADEVAADAAASAAVSHIPSTVALSAGVTGDTLIHREDEDKKKQPDQTTAPVTVTASAPNPMVRAMFQSGVVEQIDAAHADLLEKKPKFQEANVHLHGATAVLASIRTTAEGSGDDTLAARAAHARTLLVLNEDDIMAHVGVKRPLDEIRDGLDTKNPETIGKTLKGVEELL